MIRITVKLFSHLKYRFAQDELVLEFAGKITSDDLQNRINALCAEKKIHIPYRMAVNKKFISDPVMIGEEDEIAVIPPVQGG